MMPLGLLLLWGEMTLVFKLLPATSTEGPLSLDRPRVLVPGVMPGVAPRRAAGAEGSKPRSAW
jgi:hypothetical protein